MSTTIPNLSNVKTNLTDNHLGSGYNMYLPERKEITIVIEDQDGYTWICLPIIRTIKCKGWVFARLQNNIYAVRTHYGIPFPFGAALVLSEAILPRFLRDAHYRLSLCKAANMPIATYGKHDRCKQCGKSVHYYHGGCASPVHSRYSTEYNHPDYLHVA